MDAKTRRQTLITFYFIFILFGLSIITIDPLIPLIAEQIQVGFDRIGIALFIGSIAALLSNFIAGSLSDRFDIKKLILFSLILLLAGFIIFGTYLNYGIFTLVIILLRIGFGTLDTTIHSFSSKLFKKDISRVFLKLDIAWYFGACLGPLIISVVLFFDFLPRYLFFIFALAYTVFIVVFYRICPKRKIQDDLQGFNRDTHTSGKKRFSVLKDPAVIMGSLVLFFYLGALMGFSSWMTTYLLSFGIRVAYGSAILSLYWFFSIIGMIITTRIISRVREITILLSGCLVGTICLFIFCFIPNIYLKIVILSMQAVFFAGIFPLTTSISAKRDKENSGTILGFTIAFAFAGSIIFQPIYGYIAEYLGKNYIAYLALGGSIIGLVFTIILFRIIRKKHS
ncbi:MAG: MFS transporter [Actinomycetia bacterium]|nr:MFS transporter [Actinomycetes bacterium]